MRKMAMRKKTIKRHETVGAMKKHQVYKLYLIGKIMELRRGIKEDRDRVLLAWGNTYVHNKPEHIERRNAYHVKREERQREVYNTMDYPRLLEVYKNHVELRVAEKIRVGTI